MKKIKISLLILISVILLIPSCASSKDILNLWTEDSNPKDLLISYVDNVTNKNSPDFIPIDRRIAVFDFDGTLFCETDPSYFDYTLLVYRVTEDPDYRNKASKFEKEVAEKIITLNKTGKAASNLEVDHGKAIASAFKDMTLEEFYNYIQKFKETPMPSYENMKRGDGFYLPMLQVIKYLQDNNFTVYIVSGTDRFIVRGIFKNSVLKDLPLSQIIGSDETLVATNQENTDGLKYQFTHEDEVILGGEFIIKNLKMNKVSAIIREIGVQPVLSFGNSTGDTSMANYTITNNEYKSLAFMLCCDDLTRENGNIDKANTMFELCEKNNWIPVSMKNDWKTIYF